MSCNLAIVFVHWVIEEYDDGNDPPEPWGWYEHPSDQKLEIGQQITLSTLDGKPHHDVKINRIEGSTLYVEISK